jgi:hypothetical protein
MSVAEDKVMLNLIGLLETSEHNPLLLLTRQYELFGLGRVSIDGNDRLIQPFNNA